MIETINQINREVARELSQEENLVRSINTYYWRTLKSSISSGEYTSIWVKNVGTLVVSRNKLRKKISGLIKSIRYYKSTGKGFKNRTNQEYLLDLMIELKLMVSRRNDIAKAYKEKEDRIRVKKSNKIVKC